MGRLELHSVAKVCPGFPAAHEGIIDFFFVDVVVGNFVLLDMLRPILSQGLGSMRLIWLVDQGSTRYMESGLVQASNDNNYWTDLAGNVVCELPPMSEVSSRTGPDTSGNPLHRFCSINVVFGRYFRFVFQESLDTTFCLSEVRLVMQ
jgi:hypothetical protein